MRMAKVTVMCWQEIPSAVEVRDAAGTTKLQLSQRFMELIDMAAMRRNLTGSDDYIAQWRRDRRPDREGAAADIARELVIELEAGYEALRAAVAAQPAAGAAAGRG
jgi:Virulence factor